MSESPDRIIASKSGHGGMLRRIIGSTDVDGQGTLHELAHLGPFILLDDAENVPGPGMPPFGSHPHAGLVAISYIPTGGEWRTTCNVPGHEERVADVGQSVMLSAGRGVVHDESTATDGTHELFQIILRLPRAAAASNATLDFIPTRKVEGGATLVFSPDDLARLGIDATLHHAKLDHGALRIPIPETQDTGFAYVRHGSCRVNGASLFEGDIAVFEGHAAAFEISSDAQCEVLTGSGARIAEPWVKLLGNNGFVVAPSEEEARRIMGRYEDEREAFGSDV